MAFPISVIQNDALSHEGPISFRLEQHEFDLPTSGHHVGIWEGGCGTPLVVCHGYAANGEVYLAALNRLTEWFRVIIIDTPGHGRTAALPFSKVSDLDEYVSVFTETIDYLGLKNYFLAGHSFGGRLVCEVAAVRPDSVIAVIAIDAIIGQLWDDIIGSLNPLRQARMGIALIADTVNFRPMGWRRAMKMGKAGARLLWEMVTHPEKRMLVALAIRRSPNSAATLERLHLAGIPGIVLHGEDDGGVPVEIGAEAATRAGWAFEPIPDAGHSWLLLDPNSCQEIFRVCLNPEGPLAVALEQALEQLGLSANASASEIERCMCAADARILGYGPSRPLDRRLRVARPAKFGLKH